MSYYWWISAIFGSFVIGASTTSTSLKRRNMNRHESIWIQPPKFNIAPQHSGLPIRKVVVKPAFFRGYVKLRGCRPFVCSHRLGLNLHQVDDQFGWRQVRWFNKGRKIKTHWEIWHLWAWYIEPLLNHSVATHSTSKKPPVPAFFFFCCRECHLAWLGFTAFHNSEESKPQSKQIQSHVNKVFIFFQWSISNFCTRLSIT